jgi:2-polyprenyl-3-methyl-5-hydroxy-6-metoxy-1,4-benzoquinol methylase
MDERTAWEKFFDSHAPVYMDNVFVKNTLAEIDFILEELRLNPGSKILDVGCGTGRHAIELSKRGYHVTGVDISSGMIAEGKKNAEEAGVDIEWIQSDATNFTSDKQFDAALCLCEGAFCLLGSDDDPVEHDLSILKNINTAIKPGARLIMTTLNGYCMIRGSNAEDVENGVFDPISLCRTNRMESETPEGKQELIIIEHGYIPSELTMLLRSAGFDVEHIWGGTAGNWGKRPIDLDEMEIMAVARKPD